MSDYEQISAAESQRSYDSIEDSTVVRGWLKYEFAPEIDWIGFGQPRVGAEHAESTQERFERLAREWDQATLNMSSFDDMISHPAYQGIISMGTAVVPYLLADLK